MIALALWRKSKGIRSCHYCHAAPSANSTLSSVAKQSRMGGGWLAAPRDSSTPRYPPRCTPPGQCLLCQAVVASPAWAPCCQFLRTRATHHKEETETLVIHRGARRSGPSSRTVSLGSSPGHPRRNSVILRKDIQKPATPHTGQPRLQLRHSNSRLRSSRVSSWGAGLSPSPSWAAFPPPSAHSCVPSTRGGRKAAGGDGRTQPDPQDSPQPSLPWQRCYFYPVVHDAQSSDFLCSKEARQASALILQCSTLSQRPEKEKE